MVLHLLPLPAAPLVNGLGEALQIENSKWRAIHVLSDECPCSAAVAEHLIHRGPISGLDELVELSGSPQSEIMMRLTSAGYRVRRVTSDELIRDLGIRGAPWLVVIDPTGRTAYSGGYAAERPQNGVELQEISILHRLMAGEAVKPFPAFGCAIDPPLKRAMDPLGLKYW